MLQPYLPTPQARVCCEEAPCPLPWHAPPFFPLKKKKIIIINHKPNKPSSQLLLPSTETELQSAAQGRQGAQPGTTTCPWGDSSPLQLPEINK